jgi:hypothetical protein
MASSFWRLLELSKFSQPELFMTLLQKAVLFNAKSQSGKDAKFLREFPRKNLRKG